MVHPLRLPLRLSIISQSYIDVRLPCEAKSIGGQLSSRALPARSLELAQSKGIPALKTSRVYHSTARENAGSGPASIASSTWQIWMYVGNVEGGTCQSILKVRMTRRASGGDIQRGCEAEKYESERHCLDRQYPRGDKF